MKKINTVIFDRDGVLTFFLFKKVIEAFSKFIPEFTLQEGMSIWESLGKVHGFPKNSEEEILFFDKFWQALADHYTISPKRQAAIQQFNYMEFIDVFPDTLPALRFCKQKNMKVGCYRIFLWPACRNRWNGLTWMPTLMKQSVRPPSASESRLLKLTWHCAKNYASSRKSVCFLMMNKSVWPVQAP